MLNRTSTIILAMLASAGSAAPAFAGGCDYSLGSYTTGFMPDFDQRRQPGPLFFDGMNFVNIPDGLPGNGSNYCSPASHINVMGYLANHGFPALMPGGSAQSWGAQSNYERVTDAIQEMGVFMQTDPSAGTTCCGHSGCVAYLDEHAPGKFIVSSYTANTFDAPTIGDLAFCVLAGGFVNVMVGWFENTDVNQWQKTGGHVVTMVGLEGWCGGNRKIKIRDPGNDSSNLMAQSTFANNSYTLQQLPGFFDSDGTSGFDVYFQRTYERMVNYNASDGRIGLINGYRVILPKYGVTLTPPPMQQLSLLNPIRPTHSTLEPVVNLTIPGLARICWIDVAPDGFSVYCTGADTAGNPDPRVFRVNRATGEVQTVYTGIAPTHIACGRGRDLYIADGPTLTKLDFSQSPTGVQVVTHGEEVDALAYDDTTDTLHALFVGTGSSNSVRSYMNNIGASAWLHPIPTSVGINGTPFMAVSPLDGAIWIRSQNSPTMYRLVLDRVLGLVVDETATIPQTVGDLGIDISVEQTREHILLARQVGTAAHYSKNTAGQWGPAPGSDFEGLPVHGVLKLARSRTNFTPDMDGPLNDEELPGAFSPPEWDCPGDVDENGEVGFSDITGILTNWGPAPEDPADADGNGTAAFSDVTLVLTNWGPCP